MQRRWLAPVWMFGLVSMALALEHFSPPPDSLAARALRAEPLHLVAHPLLYGTLAALLASLWFPAHALVEPRALLRRRALAAGAMFALAAGAQGLRAGALARAAVALSWARMREGRHTPREVLGAWGIAGASGVLTRWAG